MIGIAFKVCTLNGKNDAEALKAKMLRVRVLFETPAFLERLVLQPFSRWIHEVTQSLTLTVQASFEI